jgi:tRNA pseudouridine32 synthase/23S rRNA pseudouridine746 synthase
MSQDIRIVHAGPHFVVIEKPPGMLSVPGIGPEKADCAAARVRARFPEATGPLVVHRLDMATSGLLVMALDALSHRQLSRAFEQRKVEKSYEAILDGVPPGTQGRIELPIRLDVDHRPRQIVDWEQGRNAITTWRLLGVEEGRARVGFEPETGRTHQLRVHAASRVEDPRSGDKVGLGCPIVGDRLYGNPELSPRLLLHARCLAFRDPATGEPLRYECPVPF